jgi:subtilisin family serine protease
MTLALALVSTGVLSASAASPTSTTKLNYLIVFTTNSLPTNAANAIKRAGGSTLRRYPEIGVILAASGNSSFAANMRRNSNVLGVDTTGQFATQLSDDVQADDNTAAPTPNTPALGSDSLSGLQWDMDQMHVPEAHAITGGDSSVLVGDIDTGLDYTHPDLAANVDAANSVNCVSGVPVAGAVAAMDDNGHGTHTAGTIAAALNGIGIVGVAPNVRIAGIKAGNAQGFFFPEAVICAFMWAGSHHFDVTNNSYFADPWLFNCRNDPEQRAIWNAERRAIQWAEAQGVVVVSAAGNQADDLTHPTQDATSPDDTSPVLRDIHNNCAVIPAEVAGVITVSATGNLNMKSFYSSYGIGVIDAAAPGGDSILQRTAAAVNGRVLSTWPASLELVTCAAARRLIDASGATYCYQQGTSMASPHAAGLAALLISQGVAPSAVGAAMQASADPIACPDDTSMYDFFPAVDNGALQTCTGGIGNNSWYGAGQINALTAVSGH